MIRFILALTILITGCSTISNKNNLNLIYKDNYHYGILNESLLMNHNGYPWFEKQYNKYMPQINNIDINLLNETSIKIFMGTWCHDSEREVPRFFKILNRLGYDQKNLQIIGLKKDKKGYFNNYSHYKITNTPTIVFFKDANEIGRIIERPKGSLELQIQLILEKAS
jgi:thiol-disulfide isomerase/thioredoxin|tara:strand:- start:12905 stop:13405 length:501 start_codon:yes stop_codon:yes gene_type:complete